MRGCVPKKLLVYASQFRTSLDLARAYGWPVENKDFQMSAWQDGKVAELDRLEAIYRSTLEKSGVNIVSGKARIINPHCVMVGGQEITCKTLLIATGSRPVTAPVAGLESAWTSEDVLNLRAVPKKIAVIGAGYIGVEFASMFAKLGSDVSIVFRSKQPLKGLDLDLSQRLGAVLQQEGVKLYPETSLDAVEKTKDGYRLHTGNHQQLACDAILNATGRVPNTENLGLLDIGISLDQKGAILVNPYSQTSVPGVHAIGDVTSRINLTPLAIAQGRAFSETVFGGIDVPYIEDQVPTAIFTGTPIATVGLTEEQAAAQGEVLIYEHDFRTMLTAFAGREERTYIKLVVDARTDRVLGIHMVGADAPEIIQSLAVALRANATKRHFDQTYAVHPTVAEEFVLLRKPVRRIGCNGGT